MNVQINLDMSFQKFLSHYDNIFWTFQETEPDTTAPSRLHDPSSSSSSSSPGRHLPQAATIKVVSDATKSSASPQRTNDLKLEEQNYASFVYDNDEDEDENIFKPDVGVVKNLDDILSQTDTLQKDYTNALTEKDIDFIKV